MGELESAGRSIVHAHPTSLVGRERERAEVIDHLMTSPVTTLTGPGGVGKTTLAMNVAAAVANDFPNGVRLSWLGSLRTALLVAPEVAASVGLPRSGGRTYADAIAEWLTDSDVLLVLDNCEHVVTSVGDLVEELTARLPRLRVLATSREPLWVAGEVVYRLAPLSVAGMNATSEEVAASEAVQLFVERAQMRSPQTALTDHSTELVGEICRRLDGLPLAIELAAARVAGLELEDIASHLDDLFNLLPQATRRVDGERRSLRSTVEWSDALLADEERALLRHMAVFAGGAELAAIEGVCAADGQSAAEIADLTARLVEKSLLIKYDSQSGYHMLETIRQYASDQLTESGEADELRDAHAAWFLDLAQQIGGEIVAGDEGAHIDVITGVEDNIRLALAHFIDHRDATSALGLATSLAIFWYIQGQHREGIRWIEEALEVADRVPADLHAAALFNLAFLLAHDTDDWAAAAKILDQGIDVITSSSEPHPILGYLLCLRGECDVFAGEAAAAIAKTEQGLEIIRSFEDAWGTGFGLWNVGFAHQLDGNIERATAAWQEMCDLMRDHDIGLLLMVGGNSLAELAEDRGDLPAARTLLEEALGQRRQIGAKQLGYVHGSLPRSMLALARVLGKQGHDHAASVLLEEALPLARELREAEAVDEIRELQGVVPLSVVQASLRFNGQVWSIEFAGQRCHVADVRGLWHLRELLTRPSQPVPAVVLAYADQGTPMLEGDAGPLLDRQALKQYRQRLADLDEDLDEAHLHADIEREAALRHERESLIAELSRATGLGGKARPAASSAERARLNVTRTIRHAIKHLEDAIPALAAHLDQSVRTGNFCAYEPAEEVNWQT
jgi:predicted ATPase